MILIFRPKSPPNSPNPELSTLEEDLKDVYINNINANESGQDILCDWESQPNLPKWANLLNTFATPIVALKQYLI